MKKIFLLLTVLMSVLISLSCSGTNADVRKIKDNGILRVGVKSDVPHFGYLNPDTGEIEGMEIDLAKKIAGDIFGDENKISFTPLTAQTRGPMLENGEIDLVIATFTITEERRENFNFSEPYYTDEIGFLVKKDAGFTAFADLNGKIVGVVNSGTARDALTEKAQTDGINVTFSEYSVYPEIKAALTSGEIDVFVADKSILTGYIDENCVILDEGFNPQNYGVASKLENKKLIRYIDEFIKKITDDGTLNELHKKWNLKK